MVKKEGQSTDVRFYGFDGNGESEYISVANFLIDYLDRFQHFKGRDLNAHMPTLDMHRRMYRVFEPMRKTLATGNLTPNQAIELLLEQIHPENRRRKATAGSGGDAPGGGSKWMQ